MMRDRGNENSVESDNRRAVPSRSPYRNNRRNQNRSVRRTQSSRSVTRAHYIGLPVRTPDRRFVPTYSQRPPWRETRESSTAGQLPAERQRMAECDESGAS